MDGRTKCDGCVGYNFQMPPELDEVIYDYQTKLRGKKTSLNKFQILFKIIREWKMTVGENTTTT